MKIRNINDKWGDPVDFDSVEDMAATIELCGYDLPPDSLREGVDYEVITEDNDEEKIVYRFGDGSAVCAECMPKYYPDTQEPETGWTVGHCDYCDSDDY